MWFWDWGLSWCNDDVEGDYYIVGEVYCRSNN